MCSYNMRPFRIVFGVFTAVLINFSVSLEVKNMRDFFLRKMFYHFVTVLIN